MVSSVRQRENWNVCDEMRWLYNELLECLDVIESRFLVEVLNSPVLVSVWVNAAVNRHKGIVLLGIWLALNEFIDS